MCVCPPLSLFPCLSFSLSAPLCMCVCMGMCVFGGAIVDNNDWTGRGRVRGAVRAQVAAAAATAVAAFMRVTCVNYRRTHSHTHYSALIHTRWLWIVCSSLSPSITQKAAKKYAHIFYTHRLHIYFYTFLPPAFDSFADVDDTACRTPHATCRCSC